MKKLMLALSIAFFANVANATSDLDYINGQEYAAKKLDIARDLYIDAISVIVAKVNMTEDDKKKLMIKLVKRYDYQIVCQAVGDSKESCEGGSE